MIYDVSLPLSPELVRWPGDPTIESSTFGDAVKISRWVLGSHAGTHVDAPAHYLSDGCTVDRLDPAVMLGPCLVLDLPDVPVITADQLASHALIGIERLLLRTRNSARWQQSPTSFDPDYVGLDLSAAQTLLALGTSLVGIDGLSIEPYSGSGEVHEALLRASVVILEGLNLSGVPAGSYQLVCAPLPLAGADGAPARVWLIENGIAP